MDFTEQIKAAIRETAARRADGGITTAEGMIPLMDASGYPNKLLDIAYGGRTEAEKLDIFYPEQGGGPWPVFIEVHGGAWYFGQKRSVEFEPFLAGLKRGFACVSLGYTLSPAGHYPLPVLEIKAAVRWLRRHAAQYRLDPDRIVLWGGSAGAHLAALAAASCDTGYLEEDLSNCGTGDAEEDLSGCGTGYPEGDLSGCGTGSPKEKLSGCGTGVLKEELSGSDGVSAKPDALVLWYGCFDYEKNGRLLDDWIYRNFFGVEDLRQAERELKLSSPLVHLTADACPTFLQHGLEDSVVPYRQSVGYYDALVRAGAAGRSRLELLPGCDHADARMFASENVEKVFTFAEEVFAGIL